MGFELSVEKKDGERLWREWEVAGLHPDCVGAGCGTADFTFPTEAERQEAKRIAGDSFLWNADDEDDENG